MLVMTTLERCFCDMPANKGRQRGESEGEGKGREVGGGEGEGMVGWG
jgi:hypothetical protein